MRNETLLSWTFPVIKIRFSSNQNIGEGESNFDDWKCQPQQSFISQEITSLKIHTLVNHLDYYFFLQNVPQSASLNMILCVVVMGIPTQINVT